MNAVGIDVSKEKSTVAIYQPGNQVILKPRDYYNDLWVRCLTASKALFHLIA